MKVRSTRDKQIWHSSKVDIEQDYLVNERHTVINVVIVKMLTECYIQDCSFLIVQIFHYKSYQHQMNKGLFLPHPPSSHAAFYPFGSESLLKVLVLMVLALLGL